MGAMAAMAALQVASSIQQAKLAKVNAKIAGKQAEHARARGQWDAMQIRQRARLISGAQRAGFAGQGVDVSTGSAVAIQAETAYLAELDVSQALQNASLRAWNFDVQGANLDFQAKLKQQAALIKLAASGKQTADSFGVPGSGTF